MGLGLRVAVLIAVLALLFIDSSCAQHRKPPRKKPTDPHYKYKQHYDYKKDDDYDRKGYYDDYDRVKDYGRQGYDDYDRKPYDSYEPPYGKEEYKGYGGYDSYAGYEDADYYPRDGYYDDYDGHKSKHKKEPKLAGHVKLNVDTCAVKFPGAAPDTLNVPAFLKQGNLTELLNYISLPSTVVGRLSVSCKHRSHPYAYDSYDSYGKYDSYDSYDSYGDYGDSAHNKTKPAGELGKCYFKGITDDCIKYAVNVSGSYPAFITFICIKDKEGLLVTGIYTGQAAGQGPAHNLLPLTRYNVGLAFFDVTGCRNANAAIPKWPGECGHTIDPNPNLDKPAGGFIELDLTI